MNVPQWLREAVQKFLSKPEPTPPEYKPYQIVALADKSGLVELMCYPFSDGKRERVFARTIIGDETSAKYIDVASLGEIRFATAPDELRGKGPYAPSRRASLTIPLRGSDSKSDPRD